MTTTATVITDTPQSDGRRSITVRYDSGLGDTVTRHGLVSSNYDIATELPELISAVEEAWRQEEIQSMQAIVADGSLSVEQIIAGFKWMDLSDAVTEAIRWGVEGDDPRSLANMESVFNYIEANFSDSQITALTGIAQDKIDLYRLRIGKALGVGRVKDELDAIEQTRSKLNG